MPGSSSYGEGLLVPAGHFQPCYTALDRRQQGTMLGQQLSRGSMRARGPAPVQKQAAVAPLRPSQTPFSFRAASIVVRNTVSTNDFKNGLTVEIDGVPFKVIEFLHVKPGKGAAFVRSKLKNLLTGNNNERTFRAGETLNIAAVERREGQFTYAEGDNYVFMDNESYEETRLPKDDWAQFLKEGTTCSLLFFNGKVISVEPPQFMDLLVAEAPPGVKGNTASGGGTKSAVLETGAVINVPLFIETGELIKIDTRTGSYLSRAKE
ncbi:MAG: elongation factor P (EF-P) KOW-like domain-containing protein [Monoraphidium minutum]|nr:MAG: elongation factor P (EF-P) KOW-like domain-containing protein [Monoraphidium minutum]